MSVDDHSDRVRFDPNPVYIADTQGVVWYAEVTNGGKGSEAKIKHVRYLKQNENYKGKATGKKDPRKQPDCSQAASKNQCTSVGMDVEPCIEHPYVAIVHHVIDSNGKDKFSDPELEVAGTTTSSPANNTSGTSGTSSTRGYR